MDITIKLTDRQEAILKTEIPNIQGWVADFVNARMEIIVDKMVINATDKNPDKFDMADKIELTKDVSLTQ